MKKLILAACILIGAQGVFAQSPVTQNVGDFTALRVSNKIPVTLVASSSQKVEVTGAQNGNVQVINKNGELKIRMSTLKSFNGSDVNVTVYYNTSKLNTVQASQGATIQAKDDFKGSALSLSASQGSTITLGVKTKDLQSSVGSGGTITVSGTSNTQTVKISSGGTFTGDKLKAKQTTVTVSAGGTATVYASDSVDAKIRAGGTINIYGKPKTVNKKTTAGGTINVY